jgi:hypothetical protein
MQKLIDHWHKANMTDRIKERFDLGALLWLIKSNDCIAGYAWPIQETMAAAFPLPITPHDAIFFDAHILDVYRGHSFYRLLMNYMFGQLKLMGATRVFGLLYGWNSSVISGIKKTHFHIFSKVRKLHFLGRNITVWS